MKVGLVGLGRMGQAIAYRLIKYGHEVFGFDPKVDSAEKIKLVNSLSNLAQQVEITWIMVPAGKPVDDVINELLPNLKPESILIDGGNSNFKDTVKRYEKLKLKNIHFVDCGTSGGLHGKEIGFSLMVGSDRNIFEKIEPILKSIATENGYGYMGPSGSGHYVKMIHNGIEYSLLQAYAEGFDLLKNNNRYKNLDLEKISGIWLNGSVIRSWILQLAKNVFSKDQNFKDISGDIGENLTGRWTLEEAKKQNIEMLLLEKALRTREWSRKNGGNYTTKIIAMLRHEFGGHEIKKTRKDIP